MTFRSSIFGRVRLTAISCTAAALVLSGCSNSDSPQGSPSAGPTNSASPTASVTHSPSPTPKPAPVYKPADAKGRAQNVPVPVKPAVADKNSKEGLEAFAKYWYSLLNYGFETGDLSRVKSVTSDACAMCGKIFPGVLKWNSAGRWVEGGAIVVHACQSRFVETLPGQFQVAIQSEQEAGVLRNADGSVGQRVTPSGMLGDLMIAKYANGKWHALNVDRLGG